MAEDSAQPDQDSAPVFGLTKAQLQPIVEAAAGEAVATFDVAISRTPRADDWGGACEPLMLEFIIRACGGTERRVPVFAKRYLNSGPREARHYAWLSAQGAPVPRFYGGVLGPENREVIFLECIEAPNEESRIYGDAEACRAFLRALARFSATPIPRSAVGILPRPDWSLRLGPTGAWDDHRGYWPAGRVLEEFRELEVAAPREDRLGLFCRNPQDCLREMQIGAERLVEPISRMKLGLVHDDFRPAQTGWRQNPREAVIYDLEFVCLGPRFHDVATVLGNADNDPSFCLPRAEMAHIYLREYAEAGGDAPQLEAFLEGIGILYLAHHLSVLGWWSGQAYFPSDDPDQGERQRRRDELCDWLAFLLVGLRRS